MNPITLANLHNFCRVCLRELNLTDPSSAFDKPLTTELIKIVTCITVEQELLTKICRNCHIRVVSLSKFREKAIASTGICKMLIAEFIDEDALPRLKSFCRVCLQRRTGKNEDRFSFKMNAELSLSMFECTGLQIQKIQSTDADILADDERFPDIICEKCYFGFSNFAEIRSLAKLSQEYVENLLNESRTLKQEIQEAKAQPQLQQLSEQCEVIFQNESSIKLELEEYNIKVEPLDFVANENIERSSISDVEDTSQSDINQSVSLLEEEIMEDFEAREIGDSEHSNTTTDEESDKLCDIETELTKVKIKKTTKQKRKQLECKYCSKKFRNRIHFEGHVKGAHEGVENPFNCHACDNHFNDYNALQRHITRKHKANDEALKKTWKGNIFEPPKKSSIHVCLQCNRQFTRKSHLEEHMNSVHLAEHERPYRCQFCQKSFGSSKTLQRHEKNHSSEKPFACEFCPKRYNIKADFNAHMQRHSCSDVSLLCPICKRLKANVEELNAHVEMHMKSRQHQCTTCGKIFTKLFHLKEHETSVHLKLRPFKCTICEKTFATQRSQKEHEQLHDPNAEKKAICEVCQLGFINRKQLSYHKAKEHKTKESKNKESKRKKTKKIKENQETSFSAAFPLDWLS